MQCNRLLNLSKQWYLHVRDETMAPARMVQFIKQHVTGCPICQEDPDIEDEILKITEIILPESKIPKAVRLKQEEDEAEREREKAAAEAEDNNSNEAEESTEEEFIEEDEEDPLPSEE